MVLQPKFPQNPYKPIPFENPELAKYKEQPVTETEAKKLAKGLGWENFIETSALTQHNLKEVFDEAIMASLKGRKSKKKQAAKKAAWHQGCNCAILWRKKADPKFY